MGWEADLRAERPGHECPVIFANAKLCSGLERSDKINGLQ